MLYKPIDVLHLGPTFVAELAVGLAIEALEDQCKSTRPEPETMVLYHQMLKLREVQDILEDLDEQVYKVLELTPALRDESINHSKAIMHYADMMAGRV